MDGNYPMDGKSLLKYRLTSIFFGTLAKSFGTTMESDKWQIYADQYLAWSKKQVHSIVENLSAEAPKPSLDAKPILSYAGAPDAVKQYQ